MSVVNVNGCHPRIIETIERMLIDIKYKMPFYGEFNLMVNFKDASTRISTCSVNMTRRGMFFYYNYEFLSNLGTKDGKIMGDSAEEREVNDWEGQKQVNFILLHQDFHLLFNHPQRTAGGRFDPAISNVAQDMIINNIIWEDIDHNFISVPKYPDIEENRNKGRVGKNMTLFIPKDYPGEAIFEELYMWLKDRKDEHRKKLMDGEEFTGDDYGPFATVGGQDMDTYSLNRIFSDIEENQGQYLDEHMEDDIPEELRDSMVRDVIDRLRSRGIQMGNIDETLNKLRKKRKDHLREIKRSVSNEIMGTKKMRSITRPNRRGIKGIKGNRKVKSKINVILDTSGSMYGMFEKVLEYVFQNDIEINVCQVDTAVHEIVCIKHMKQLARMDIHGLGGTMLQPAVDLISQDKNYNKYNTVILTDGWCDTLDMSQMRGKVLGISCGDAIPISAKPKAGYKEIIVEKE